MGKLFTKQTEFLAPTTGEGKWHVRHDVVFDRAKCDPTITLSQETAPLSYPASSDMKTIHPLCCRRCASRMSK